MKLKFPNPIWNYQQDAIEINPGGVFVACSRDGEAYREKGIATPWTESSEAYWANLQQCRNAYFIESSASLVAEGRRLPFPQFPRWKMGNRYRQDYVYCAPSLKLHRHWGCASSSSVLCFVAIVRAWCPSGE